MNLEEKQWVMEKLATKSKCDRETIKRVFIEKYARLLDCVIREHCSKLCVGCSNSEFQHCCRLHTGDVLHECGIETVLGFITQEQKNSVWKTFIGDIETFFKNDILRWLENFNGLTEELQSKKGDICDYMCSHFSNRADNPKPCFLPVTELPPLSLDNFSVQ